MERDTKRTLVDVKAKTVVHALPSTISNGNGRTLRDTFVKVKAEALVDALSDQLEKTRLANRTRKWAT